jgi:hypothetical protein
MSSKVKNEPSVIEISLEKQTIKALKIPIWLDAYSLRESQTFSPAATRNPNVMSTLPVLMNVSGFDKYLPTQTQL